MGTHPGAESQLTGRACGIAADGGLIIETLGGKTVTVHAGDVWLQVK
jgi:biotin-(acetyl-CoA carboxylase) ligase